MLINNFGRYYFGVHVFRFLAFTGVFSQTAIAQDKLNLNAWDDVKHSVRGIAEKGKWDWYLSGYAHHSRSTYSETRLQKLNEEAWGGGFGKTLRNGHGNDESLYAMVIRDSNRNLQWSAGYAYQWIYPISNSCLELGGGVSALLIRRVDWFDGVPFPALLPVFSAGTRQVKVMGTYVPKISTKKGKGNVLFLFGKLEF